MEQEFVARDVAGAPAEQAPVEVEVAPGVEEKEVEAAAPVVEVATEAPDAPIEEEKVAEVAPAVAKESEAAPALVEEAAPAVEGAAPVAEEKEVAGGEGLEVVPPVEEAPAAVESEAIPEVMEQEFVAADVAGAPAEEAPVEAEVAPGVEEKEVEAAAPVGEVATEAPEAPIEEEKVAEVAPEVAKESEAAPALVEEAAPAVEGAARVAEEKEVAGGEGLEVVAPVEEAPAAVESEASPEVMEREFVAPDVAGAPAEEAPVEAEVAPVVEEKEVMAAALVAAVATEGLEAPIEEEKVADVAPEVAKESDAAPALVEEAAPAVEGAAPVAEEKEVAGGEGLEVVPPVEEAPAAVESEASPEVMEEEFVAPDVAGAPAEQAPVEAEVAPGVEEEVEAAAPVGEVAMEAPEAPIEEEKVAEVAPEVAKESEAAPALVEEAAAALQGAAPVAEEKEVAGGEGLEVVAPVEEAPAAVEAETSPEVMEGEFVAPGVLSGVAVPLVLVDSDSSLVMNKYVEEVSVNVHYDDMPSFDGSLRSSGCGNFVVDRGPSSSGFDGLGDSKVVDEVSGDVSADASGVVLGGLYSCSSSGGVGVDDDGLVGGLACAPAVFGNDASTVLAVKSLEGGEWEFVPSDEGADYSSRSSRDSGFSEVADVGDVGKSGLPTEWEFVAERSRNDNVNAVEASGKDLVDAAAGPVLEHCGREVTIKRDITVAVPHQESTGISDWEIVASGGGGAAKEDCPGVVSGLVEDSAEVLNEANIVEDISIESSSPGFEDITLMGNRSIAEVPSREILPVVENVRPVSDAVTVVGSVSDLVAQKDTEDVEEPVTVWNLKYFKKRPLTVVPRIQIHAARQLKEKHHKAVGLPWPPAPMILPCEGETAGSFSAVDSPHIESEKVAPAPMESAPACESTESSAVSLSHGLNETTSVSENVKEVERVTEHAATVAQSGEEKIPVESEPVFSLSDKDAVLISGEKKDMASVIQSLENGSSGLICGLLLESGEESAAAASA